MDIFKFDNYKGFVAEWVKKQPNNGRGQYRKLAQYLNVSPVIVTQVLRGDRQFSSEHALEICEFLGLSDIERDYFLLLVQFERAGTFKLKQVYKKRLSLQQEKADQIKSRLPSTKKFKDEAKATFYSNWYYSGIRLITAIESYQTAEAIAEKFNLPLFRVREVLEFLVENGLCSNSDGRITVGIQSTHVDAKSPLVSRHHRNWRDLASRQMDLQDVDNLFFTSPTVVDNKATEKIRSILLKAIEDCSKTATEAPSDELRCLNIDWFKI